jgi:hypothetical protein
LRACWLRGFAPNSNSFNAFPGFDGKTGFFDPSSGGLSRIRRRFSRWTPR